MAPSTKLDKRIIWMRSDLNVQSKYITAKLEGVIQDYTNISPNAAIYIIITYNGTEYRSQIWLKNIDTTDPSEIYGQHKDKIKFFMDRYGGCQQDKIVEFFIKRTNNPTYKAVLSTIPETPATPDQQSSPHPDAPLEVPETLEHQS